MRFLIVAMLFIGGSAYASVHGVQRLEFKCSNGANYDVGVYFQSYGGNDGARWQETFLCRQGTLKEKFYGWQLPRRESHVDMAACIDDEFADTDFCHKEFARLNPTKGPDLNTFVVRHGR